LKSALEGIYPANALAHVNKGATTKSMAVLALI
jgi:hypothetical protein